MTFAQNYTPTTSFANEETSNASGRSTVKTVKVDTEFANISASINALNTNLKLLQRDDGKLKDLIVEPYALSEQTRSIMAANGKPKGSWQNSMQYDTGDCVEYNSVAYMCSIAHTSTAIFDYSLWIAISSNGVANSSAQQASASANEAAQSAQTAQTASANLQNAVFQAETAKDTAVQASTNATNSANTAQQAALAAQNAAQASETSASASAATAAAALTSENAAAASQADALVSKNAAAASEAAAANSAASINTSANTASTQADIATTKATEASGSATSAELSEANALASSVSAGNSADLAQAAALNLPTASSIGADKFLKSNVAGDGWQGLTASQLVADIGEQLQSQAVSAFVSGGTAPSFTLTPVPPIVTYAVSQRFHVTFHGSGTTGINSLNISDLGAKSLKQYDSNGAKIPAVIAANMHADVVFDGIDLLVVDPLPSSSGSSGSSSSGFEQTFLLMGA